MTTKFIRFRYSIRALLQNSKQRWFLPIVFPLRIGGDDEQVILLGLLLAFTAFTTYQIHSPGLYMDEMDFVGDGRSYYRDSNYFGPTSSLGKPIVSWHSFNNEPGRIYVAQTTLQNGFCRLTASANMDKYAMSSAGRARQPQTGNVIRLISRPPCAELAQVYATGQSSEFVWPDSFVFKNETTKDSVH